MNFNYLDKKRKHKRLLTVEKLKESPQYQNLSDAEAEDIIVQLDLLSEIIVKHLIYIHDGLT